MKFQRKRDMKEQIDELQAIINLQEQAKKLFTQGTEETVCKNKDLLGFLRGNVREGMHEVNLAMKYDHVTINRACRERKQVKIALSDYTVEQARETMRNYVFDRMNVHNILLYEVKCRGKLLEDLQLRLQQLIDLETASPEARAQLQMIRQLENNIEKMQVKIMTAEKTHILYLKMLDVLRDELSHLPLILDDLEHMVEVYQVELKGMHLMAKDTMEAMEAAKQARRDVNMDFPTLMGRDGLKGAKLEASKAQIEYQSLVTMEVDKIKCAVQCSHLWDIAGRFMAQKKSEENLQQQIAECEKKRRELKGQLKELELEQAELKFHQTPSSISSRKLEEELRTVLEEEEERLKKVQAQVCQNQELLLHFENGVDNLIMRLCGIARPGQEEFRGEIGDMFDKLQFCETKLLYLVKATAQLPIYDFSQEEYNETFIQVRNLLEESTRDEPQNLRITYEDDEEDVREAFNFADIDHSYVPNREEIKKHGLKLIEDKTKVTKKKQRVSSKK
ncbi:coiled-coil domain-containing protein 183 isoform X2 [Rhineura floridana]|uniref:coiled-coil domain-containing protein 183 isoform X2 n=1 Tax=Rhineura floridana TaxID=261503 RepID=UPI002AC80618|nr:coiled-coil domain-containing protein 183 isoform X2 [Rhineura floridana]